MNLSGKNSWKVHHKLCGVLGGRPTSKSFDEAFLSKTFGWGSWKTTMWMRPNAVRMRTARGTSCMSSHTHC